MSYVSTRSKPDSDLFQREIEFATDQEDAGEHEARERHAEDVPDRFSSVERLVGEAQPVVEAAQLGQEHGLPAT
jgi:hypothetical protein